MYIFPVVWIYLELPQKFDTSRYPEYEHTSATLVTCIQIVLQLHVCSAHVVSIMCSQYDVQQARSEQLLMARTPASQWSLI